MLVQRLRSGGAAILLALPALWACPALAAPPLEPPGARTVHMDPGRSKIGFEVRTRFGQRIEGVFPHFEGRVDVLSDGRHQVHLKMFTGSVEIPGKPRYTGWMRGEEFFDALRHPVVEFDSLPYWPELVEQGGTSRAG